MSFTTIKNAIINYDIETARLLMNVVSEKYPDLYIQFKRDYITQVITDIKNGTMTYDEFTQKIADAIAGNLPNPGNIVIGLGEDTPESISITGKIFNELGDPIFVGVNIITTDGVVNDIVYADANGEFTYTFSDSTYFEQDIILSITDENYIYKYLNINLAASTIDVGSIILYEYANAVNSDDTNEFNNSEDNTISLLLRNDTNITAYLTIPANSFKIISSDEDYTGDTYTLKYLYVDYNDPMYDEVIPVNGFNNSTIPVIGFTVFHFYSSDGERLQLKDDSVASIKIKPVDPTDPPETIIREYFNELSMSWEYDSELTYTNLAAEDEDADYWYIGDMTHFSSFATGDAVEDHQSIYIQFSAGNNSIDIPIYCKTELTYENTFGNSRTYKSGRTIFINTSIWVPANSTLTFKNEFYEIDETINIPATVYNKQKFTVNIPGDNYKMKVNIIDGTGKPLLKYDECNKFGLLNKMYPGDALGEYNKYISLPRNYELDLNAMFDTLHISDNQARKVSGEFKGLISYKDGDHVFYGSTVYSDINIYEDDREGKILDLGTVEMYCPTETNENTGFYKLTDVDTGEVLKHYIMIMDLNAAELDSNNSTRGARIKLKIIDKYDITSVKCIKYTDGDNSEAYDYYHPAIEYTPYMYATPLVEYLKDNTIEHQHFSIYGRTDYSQSYQWDDLIDGSTRKKYLLDDEDNTEGLVYLETELSSAHIQDNHAPEAFIHILPDIPVPASNGGKFHLFYSQESGGDVSNKYGTHADKYGNILYHMWFKLYYNDGNRDLVLEFKS